MSATPVKWLVAPLLALAVAGCANESLAGLELSARTFKGSFPAPSTVFTAGARAASAVPTAAPSQVLTVEQIKAMAEKTLQVEDFWVGPFCEKYKVHYNFYNKHMDFNTGDESPTTGGEQTKEALKQVQGMKALARNPEQKDWVSYAEKFYSSVLSGNPTSWSGGWPDDESVDWFAGGWTTERKFEPNQPFIELAAKQAAMAACLKLK